MPLLGYFAEALTQPSQRLRITSKIILRLCGSIEAYMLSHAILTLFFSAFAPRTYPS
jgi:hypothetical protein